MINELVKELAVMKEREFKNRRNSLISKEIELIILGSEAANKVLGNIGLNDEIDTLKITHKTILETVKAIFKIELEWKVEIDKSKTEYFYFIDGEKIFSWGGKEVEES